MAGFGKRVAGVILAALMVAVTAGSTQAARWPYWDHIKSATYQMWFGSWGRMDAGCSMIAVTPFELATAGHCAAVEQAYKVKVFITQDMSNFIPAELVTSGWKLKKEAGDTITGTPRSMLTQIIKGQTHNLPFDTQAGDWAIYGVSQRLPYWVSVGTSKVLLLGDEIRISGYPWAGDHTVSQGVVSSIDYRLPPDQPWDHLIGADYASAPGNSGSGVFDEMGYLVGIHVAGFDGGDSIGFATPVDLFRPFLTVLLGL